MKKTLTYLIASIAFIAISGVAKAQDGTAPYAGSTHRYSVTPDANTANKSYLWAVSGGGVISGASNETSVLIDWGTTPGTYTISFTETDETTSCSTVRELEVEVIANIFYVNVAEDASDCHDLSGTVLATDATGSTTLYFTVNLNKDATWSIDSWEYDFSVAVASTDYSLSSVKVDAGAELGTGGSYSNVSVSGSATRSEIAVVVNGPVSTGTDVEITVNNGEAIVGTSVTPDNGTGDKKQVLSVNPLPNTSPISAN
jgi:hypothetical protein